MQPDFLGIKVGDVVAVKPPSDKAYLAQVLFVEGEARTAYPLLPEGLPRTSLRGDELMPQLDHQVPAA